MRKLKKALSLSLALVLSLALAVPAFAAPKEFVNESDYAKITFSISDYISVEGNVYTIEVGTIATCNGTYGSDYHTHRVRAENIKMQTNPTPYTYTDADIGAWYIPVADIYLEVVAAGSQQPTVPAQPEQPAEPGITVDKIPAKGTAAASTQAVELDGKKVEFQMYALKDEKGSTNYIKLRDLGHILNGTKAQFNVGYSKETGITVTTGQAYQGNGSEMNTPFSGDRAYAGGGQSVQINGKAVELTAFVLTDDAGGGYTYFKLRDLGAALGFNVSWSKDRGVYVETDKPYAG